MMQDKMQEIKERLGKATAGPWVLAYIQGDDYLTVDISTEKEIIIGGDSTMYYPTFHPPSENDAQFIANAPTDIQYLLDALEQAQDENKMLTEFKQKQENYVKIQHGRNYDDDEAERKLNMLAEQHVELQRKFDVMRLAVVAQNSAEGDDDVHYCYVPFDDDYNTLKSLVSDVIVHIPAGWLMEMLDESQDRERVLREALTEVSNPIHKIHWSVVSPGQHDCYCSACRKVREALAQEGTNGD